MTDQPTPIQGKDERWREEDPLGYLSPYVPQGEPWTNHDHLDHCEMLDNIHGPEDYFGQTCMCGYHVACARAGVHPND